MSGAWVGQTVRRVLQCRERGALSGMWWRYHNRQKSQFLQCRERGALSGM